ncbi:uncharacterized protein LOC131313390 [Rhododendron vialii]|uniref:uncharacterized protein LOC131313390 n=1 Tax=Rhododendron vialii TaxID=182163 RepID=UPI00265D9E2A|nr:uncharacterized protein LOC131313390 [Rhododendron vialii]
MELSDFVEFSELTGKGIYYKLALWEFNLINSMGYTEKTQRTFDLKLNLHCKNCANDVRKIVLKIEGVVSIDIDKDLELGKSTISGNVNPQTVIKKLKDRANKHAKLLGKEEEECPPKINHQEMQIVLQQNPVRIDQQKVASQPPGIISKSVDKPMERDIHDCDPKFWSILLTVTCFHAYRSFQFLLGLISEAVGKLMEMEIHDCDPKHDHELELKSYNKPFKCNKCREDGFTSGYRCKHCVYDLHKDCLEPKPTIKHDLFVAETKDQTRTQTHTQTQRQRFTWFPKIGYVHGGQPDYI